MSRSDRIVNRILKNVRLADLQDPGSDKSVAAAELIREEISKEMATLWTLGLFLVGGISLLALIGGFLLLYKGKEGAEYLMPLVTLGLGGIIGLWKGNQ